MLSDVMVEFKLIKEFSNAGFFETDHHKQLLKEIKLSLKFGKLVVLSGIIGSGKTTLVRQLRTEIEKEKEIIPSKSYSVEKSRVTMPTLVSALYYDISKEKDPYIPPQSEKRIRRLQDMLKERKKPVALIVDDAHSLHKKTLKSLKLLMENAKDRGGVLSIVLIGHPKLKNDFLDPAYEEIGSRATYFSLDGITASKREYIHWLLQRCTKSGTNIETIFSEDAVDLLADKLATPLQIEQYMTLAVEEAYKIGVKPVSPDVVESVINRRIDDLEPRLTRYGYGTKTLSIALNVRPKVIRSFFHGQLSPGQTKEIQDEMLAMGIPL